MERSLLSRNRQKPTWPSQLLTCRLVGRMGAQEQLALSSGWSSEGADLLPGEG